jgi:hypothetical protein
MEQIDIETESSSSDGGIFLQKDATIGDVKVPTPWQSTPIEYFTAEYYINDQFRKISDVQIELNSTDLEAYRSDETTQPLVKLQEKLKYSIESELVSVFVEYPAGQVIEPEEMRTILDIQSEFGDILSTPIQADLIETLSPFMSNGELDLNHSPYDAIYPTVRHFLESIDRYSQPVMGILPLIGWERRRELLREYENAQIKLLGLDYRGFKPTKSQMFDQHMKLMSDLAVRDRLAKGILYAFNFKSYHPTRGGGPIQSEAVALSTFGVDIFGGCHQFRGAGGGGEITDVKIFNPNQFYFDRIALESITESLQTSDVVDPKDLVEYGYGKRTNLRKLINADLLSKGFRKLRAAIQDGHEKEFMQNKIGYSGDLTHQAVAMAKKYDDAKGEDIAP